MKGLSVIMFLLGISCFANAIAGQWVFDFSNTSASYILFDVLLGLGCWALSGLFWQGHVLRALTVDRDPLS